MSFLSKNEIRTQFAAAMSQMYRSEVPQYASLCELVDGINQYEISASSETFTLAKNELLECERHGAIRLGTDAELSIMCRLFNVMGMLPVDYYDLSVAGIPVHSTAFRPADSSAISKNPFRIFTSLLRLDLIEDGALRQVAETALSKRQIFSEALLALIDTAEKNSGLNSEEAEQFVIEALDVFRWHQNAQVDSETYNLLNSTHRLIADVVSFKGPHINHLTPRSLNIDALQTALSKSFKAKKIVEGPPRRACPILLRQTSFIALEETVTFSDGQKGTHTARFGEVEQRGIALTQKGRDLYDQLLNKARKNKEGDYANALEKAFSTFPDSYQALHDQGLAYFNYTAVSKPATTDVQNLNELVKEGNLQITPIIYEDFLPVSAAGIFSSNLASDTENKPQIQQSPNQKSFEAALGTSVINSFSLYEKNQKASLSAALKSLGINVL